MIYVYIGAGGIVGSLLRYFLSRFLLVLWGSSFPAGTLVINLIGAFALSWFSTVIIRKSRLSPALSAGITTGFIGSFTTFSTFSMDTITLIEQEKILEAFVYTLVSASGGLCLSYLGYMAGKHRQRTEGSI